LTNELNRAMIIDNIVECLKPLDYVHALWAMGSASFDRIDEWSDIDTMVIVDDDKVEETFTVIEQMLDKLSPIELKYRRPDPGWHDIFQTIYRLEGTSQFLFIDFNVIKESNPHKNLERDMHGEPIVLFDKKGLIKETYLGKKEHEIEVKERLQFIKKRFPLARAFVLKELNRGNDIAAFANYNRMMYWPLVDALRIKHCPERYDFGEAYARYDLPEKEWQTLKELCYVSSPEDLKQKIDYAEKRFKEVIDELEKMQ